MRTLSFISIFLLFVLFSCVKNNPDPSWIEINTWKVNKNLNIDEGETNHNFSDVYLSIDDKIIGFFELPIKIPFLGEGNHKLILYPVVRNNGISATKKIYPFCESHTIYVNLVKNETTVVNPETNYYDNTQFWIEDFENTSFNITENTSISKTSLVKGNDPSILKYGNFYGSLSLTTTDSIWTGKTNPAMALPKNGAEVYLEIDYMNSNSMLTGVYAISATEYKDNPNIQLNPQLKNSMVWKKIYIDLKEIVSSSINANTFEIYFTSIIDAGLSESNVYIDNIKIVHR